MYSLTPLAGVLEGSSSSHSSSYSLVVRVAKTLCFFVATLPYAVLAGRTGQALTLGRASSEELLSGIALSLAVLALLYAIILLIEASGLDAAGRARLIVSITLPPPTLMFLGIAAQDLRSITLLPTGRGDLTPSS